MPPVAAIIASARRHGALVLVDGAQYVSHHAIDVQALDCDFLVFSGHKMLGPTGVGALYGKRSVLMGMDPFMYGGDMIMQVSRHASTYQDIPERFEAGTPNIAGIIAWVKAIDYLEATGLDAIAAHERQLLEYAAGKAAGCPWLTTYGPPNLAVRGGVFSFNARNVHSHDIGTILDSQGIAVRTGFHCAMPYMEKLGVAGTVRASFYLYNTRDEIDRLFEVTEQAWKMFS
jgi:cysteine desulfurase/selenocysteine lyase